MKRASQQHWSGKKHPYEYELSFGPLEGVPEDYTQLRVQLQRVPKHRVLGTVVLPPATYRDQASADAVSPRGVSGTADAQGKVSPPMHIKVGLYPSGGVTGASVIHGPKLVELVLQGKTTQSAILESWHEVATFELDLSLLSRSDPEPFSVDVPLAYTTVGDPIIVMVHVSSWPTRKALKDMKINYSRPPVDLANMPTTSSMVGGEPTAGTLTSGPPQLMHRSTSEHGRLALSSRSMPTESDDGAYTSATTSAATTPRALTPRSSQPHPLIATLSQQGGGLPGLTTEAAVQAAMNAYPVASSNPASVSPTSILAEPVRNAPDVVSGPAAPGPGTTGDMNNPVPAPGTPTAADQAGSSEAGYGSRAAPMGSQVLNPPTPDTSSSLPRTYDRMGSEGARPGNAAVEDAPTGVAFLPYQPPQTRSGPTQTVVPRRSPTPKESGGLPPPPRPIDSMQAGEVRPAPALLHIPDGQAAEATTAGSPAGLPRSDDPHSGHGTVREVKASHAAAAANSPATVKYVVSPDDDASPQPVNPVSLQTTPETISAAGSPVGGSVPLGSEWVPHARVISPSAATGHNVTPSVNNMSDHAEPSFSAGSAMPATDPAAVGSADVESPDSPTHGVVYVVEKLALRAPDKGITDVVKDFVSKPMATTTALAANTAQLLSGVTSRVKGPAQQTAGEVAPHASSAPAAEPQTLYSSNTTTTDLDVA